MVERFFASPTKRPLPILAVSVLLALFMAFFTFASSPVARAATVCTTQNKSAPSPGNFQDFVNVNAGDTVTVTQTPLLSGFAILFPDGSQASSSGGTASGTSTIAGIATIQFGGATGLFTYTITVCTTIIPLEVTPEVGGPGPVCPGPLDGRINNDPALDCAAPVAIYPAGSVDIYAINPDTSAGEFVARVEFDPASDTTRTLYQGSNPFTGAAIVVTELPGGIIQVNTAYADGKPYIVQWPADDSTQLVHLAA